MLLRTARLVAILFTALSMAPALAHLLEMPAKLGYDGPLWMTLQRSLYGPGFGTVGAFCEVSAVVTMWCSRSSSGVGGPRSGGRRWEHSASWPPMLRSGSGSHP